MRQPIVKLDHCVIHVSDWGRSNCFYRDVLGAELVERGGSACAYRFGSEQLNGTGNLPLDPPNAEGVDTGLSFIEGESGHETFATATRAFVALRAPRSVLAVGSE